MKIEGLIVPLFLCFFLTQHGHIPALGQALGFTRLHKRTIKATNHLDIYQSNGAFLNEAISQRKEPYA